MKVKEGLEVRGREVEKDGGGRRGGGREMRGV